MSELIRKTFIHLHKQDLISELRDEVGLNVVCPDFADGRQILQRYGENRIPIRNASSISASSTARSLKAKASAKRFEQMLKQQSAASADGESAVAELGIDLETNSDADDVVVAADVETAMDAAADPLEAAADDPDSDVQGDEPAATDAAASSDAAPTPSGDGALGLTSEDLRRLEAMGGGAADQEEQIDDQRFVKFRDALPPPPRRAASTSKTSKNRPTSSRSLSCCTLPKHHPHHSHCHRILLYTPPRVHRIIPTILH